MCQWIWIFIAIMKSILPEPILNLLSPSCRRSAIARIDQKCHEMPCNHQFERSYITPTVTYVEKPKRVLLNPSINCQFIGFQNFIWEIRWNRQYLRRKLSRVTQMLKWKNLSKQSYACQKQTKLKSELAMEALILYAIRKECLKIEIQGPSPWKPSIISSLKKTSLTYFCTYNKG